MVSSYQDVIKAFGSIAKYADAVGMSVNAAKQAHRRDRLSARWFAPTVRAAEARQIPIDEGTLLAIAERTPPKRGAPE